VNGTGEAGIEICAASEVNAAPVATKAASAAKLPGITRSTIVLRLIARTDIHALSVGLGLYYLTRL
jgi:hypothetical protein